MRTASKDFREPVNDLANCPLHTVLFIIAIIIVTVAIAVAVAVAADGSIKKRMAM